MALDLIARTQLKLEAAERREDWVAVLSYDHIIDRLLKKAMADPNRKPGTPL